MATVLVGVSGKKSSGKTSLCNNLKKLFEADGYTCIIENFAKPIKSEAMERFGLSYNQCYGTEDQKNTITLVTLRSIWGDLVDFWSLPHPDNLLTARQVMQQIGSYWRHHNPDYFIDELKHRLNDCKADVVLIGDLRFNNELEFINSQSKHYTIKLVNHTSPSGDSHESEQLPPDSLYNLVVYNGSCLPEATADLVYGKLKEEC